MTGGSFPFGTMGPTDISGMGMGLPTSIALDTPFATSDSHNQNGIGSLPMTSHDADVSSTRESLGSLGQLPRNFSLSDLTAELTNGAGKTQKKPLVITGELLHIFLQRVRVQIFTLTLCCAGLYLVCHFLTFKFLMWYEMLIFIISLVPQNVLDFVLDCCSGELDLGTLGSYSGSPFLTPDAFLRSPDKDVLGEDNDL
jgi:hypothetical protein